MINDLKKVPGIILWEGPSPIDGSPIACIATFESRNRKTGGMIQTWILHRDINPVEAVQTGADYAICGDCPHRRQSDGSRSCYVPVFKAPAAVWRAYQRGSYPRLADQGAVGLLTLQLRFSGRRIRWGAYGDPGMLPGHLVESISAWCEGHTGYTHQWKHEWAQWATGLLQASCDGAADHRAAKSADWATFTVLPVGTTAPTVSAKLCPATVDGSQATCETCGLCDGSRTDVWVEAHGPGSRFVTDR